MAYKPVAKITSYKYGYGANWQIPNWKHLGLDINRGRHGDQVYAYQTGKVKYIKDTPEWHQGIVVESTDKAGNPYCWVYWHIDGCKLKIGQIVKAGQNIGHIAFKTDTDRIVAPHLHVGLWNGSYDPKHSMKGGCKRAEFPMKFTDPLKRFIKNGWL